MEPDSSLTQSSEALRKPTAHIIYEESGKASFDMGNIQVDFSYVPVGQLPFHFEGRLNFEGVGKKYLRQLRELRLQDNQGHVFNLQDILPPGTVYFSPFHSEGDKTSFADSKTGKIAVFGDIAAPRTILTLFHEVGHLVQPKSTLEEAEERPGALEGQKALPTDATLVLVRERNAWAFALRKIRPFLSTEPNAPLNKNAVLADIHNTSLKFYSDKLRNVLPEWVLGLESEMLDATLTQAIEGDIAETLVLKDIDLVQEEGKQPIKDNLTPLDKVDPSLIISKPMYSFFGEDRETEPLTEDQRSLGIMAVEVYKKELEGWREKSRIKNREAYGSRQEDTPSMLKKIEHLGEYAKVVDYIKIGPYGPRGRYQVSFQVVNNDGEDDWEIQGNGYMFDIRARELNDSFPARLENYMAAKRNGKWKLVGKYSDLYEEAEGLVDELLQRKGYTDLAEIFPMGWGGHVGWLDHKNKT